MEKPVVAAKGPIPMQVESGKEYYWCTCGRSARQPYCDGSHKPTSFLPLPFRVAEAGEKYLCACKQTANPPWCDGSHMQLSGQKD